MAKRSSSILLLFLVVLGAWGLRAPGARAAVSAPLFEQFDNRWASDPYPPYAPGDTIRKWGCALCCMAMVAQGNGVTHDPDGNPVDPSNLNAWLARESAAFVSTGNTPWALMGKYTGGRVVYLGASSGGLDEIQADLDAGRSSVLNVDSTSAVGGHFVLATGQTGTSLATISINDPGYGRQLLGDSPFLGVVRGTRRFAAGAAVSSLSYAMHSPAVLLLTSETGERTGIDDSGIVHSEIPGASYVAESVGALDSAERTHEAKMLYVATPTAGRYAIDVNGTGPGPYHLDVTVVPPAGEVIASTTSGTAFRGSSATYDITLDAVTGLPRQHFGGFVARRPTEAFIMPQHVRVRINPRDPSNSTLSASGIVVDETGPINPANAATLDIGGLRFLVPSGAATAKTHARAGKVGSTVSIRPDNRRPSRARFGVTYRGDLTGMINPDDLLTVRLADGLSDRRGAVMLRAGRYSAGKVPGSVVAPGLFVSSARVAMNGGASDRLSMRLGLATSGAAPASASDLTIGFGDSFGVTIPAGEFGRAGDKYVFHGNRDGIKDVVLDYARGTMSVSGSALSLGEFPPGASGVVVAVGLGDDRRATRVRMVQKGVIKY